MSSNYFDQFDEPENGAAPADRAFEAPTERDPNLEQYANIFEAGIKREKNRAIMEAFGREIEAQPFFQLDDPSTVVSASLVGEPKQKDAVATDAFAGPLRRGVGVGFEMMGQGVEQRFGDTQVGRGLQSFGKRQQENAPDRAVPSIYDIKGIGDFATWAWESAQEGVGTSVPAIVGGVLGAPFGGVGVAVGVGAMSNVMGVGQMRNALEDERAEYFNRAERAKQSGNTLLEQFYTEEGAKLDPEKNRAIIEVAGTIIGGFDALAPTAMLMKGAPAHVVNELKSRAFRLVVAHIAKRAAQGAATEGATEAAQAMVEIAAVVRAKGVTEGMAYVNELWANRWRVIDEAAAGAAGGTAFGVMGSARDVAGAGRGASEPPTGAENFFDRFDTPEERAAAQAPQQPAETPQAPAAPTPAPTAQPDPAATPAPASDDLVARINEERQSFYRDSTVEANLRVPRTDLTPEQDLVREATDFTPSAGSWQTEEYVDRLIEAGRADVAQYLIAKIENAERQFPLERDRNPAFYDESRERLARMKQKVSTASPVAATPAPAITPAEVVSQPPVESVTPDFDPNVYTDDILTSGTIPEGARPAEIEAALPVMDERIAEVQSRLDAAKEEVAAVEGEADTTKVDALTEQLDRVKTLKAEAEAARDAAVEAAEQAKQQLIDSQPTPEMQKLVEYITGGGLLGTAEMPAIAKAAGVEPEALPALMEQAVARGVLRKNKRGEFRRAVPGSAQSQASPEQKVASVRQTVQDVARAMAPMLPRGTTVRSFAALADLPANLQGQMTEQGGTVRDAVTGNEIDAFVDPNDPRVIYLAEYALRKEGRVGHESVHILKKLNLLNDAEIKTLAERARKTGKFGKDIEGQYRQAYAGRADLDSLIDEEAAAALIEARINGESFGKKIDTILDWVIQFLERLANALRQRGFQTADDIADAVLSGDVARREAVQQFMADNDITAMAVRPSEPMLAMVDVRTGREMRRELDALGFYSKLDEVLGGFGPKDKITADTLQKRGVKAAEMEARGLKDMLADGKAVPVSDLARVAGENRVTLNEVQKAVDPTARKRAEVYQELRQERLRRRSEQNPQRIAELESELSDLGGIGEAPTRWQNYSLDPSNPTYRETVIHLPGWDERTRGKNLTAEQQNAMPDDFRSGHFSEPNIIGHMMTSMTSHQGRPVYTIDQIQSDWGQKLRDVGARSPERLADLQRQVENAEAAVDKEVNAYIEKSRSLYESKSLRERMFGTGGKAVTDPVEARQIMASNPGSYKTFVQAYADLGRLRAELFTLKEEGAPGNPLVNTTDQWVDTTLRRAIRQAAEADAEYIAIPSGDTVLSYNPGDTDGMRGFYNDIVPKNLRKLLSKIDKDSANPQKIDKLDTPSKGPAGEGFTLFPLTDKVKQSVKTEGQVMFAFAGERARTADKDRLARAVEMESAGPPKVLKGSKGYEEWNQHRTKIWKETGWFRGTEGKWRFEVDDSGLQVGRGDGEGLTDSTIRHPALAAAYPDGAAKVDTRVGFWPEKSGKFWRPEEGDADGIMAVDAFAPTGAGRRRVAAHELQHFVQNQEGLDTDGGTWQGWLEFSQYRKNWREVEARTVEKRLNMTPEQRSARPPWEDYDVPEDQQIVKFADAQNVMFAMRAVETGATRVEDIGPSDPHPGRVLAYHATGADFENFDIDQWGNFASNDLGLHFGTTGQAAEVARRFGIDPKTIEEVGGWDEAVRVEPQLQTWRPRSYPVVLNLRNPITLDPKIGSVRTASAETIVFNLEQMVDRGADVTFTKTEVDALDKAVREANARGGGLSSMPLVRQFLNDHGYDGARYRNTIDGEGWSYITWNRNTVESQTSGDLLYAMRPGDNSIQRDNPMRSVQVIVQDLAQSLGLTVRQGMRTANARAARRQGAQGIYDAATGVIRLRSVQDLNAAIQGIGLAIEHQYDAPNPQGPLGTLIALNQAELVDGFGVWFQQYLTAPAQAQANAPTFTQYFETFLDVNDPVLLAKLESAQDAIALYYQQQPAQFVESMIRDARVPGFWEGVREDMRRFGLRGTLSLRLNTFYTQAFDDTNPFAVAVWETLREFRRQTGQGLDIATNENPAKIMRLAKHSPAHAMRAMEEGIRPRNSTRPRGPSLIQAMVTALGDNMTNARNIGPGSRYRQFGAYLIARYSALEWERFRNGQKEAQPTRYPAGTFTPTQAIQFYQGVAAGLEQQYGSFRQAADMLYDYQRELLALQRDAGLISTETYDTLIQDREYVPMYRVFEDSEDLASSRALGGGPGGILKRKRGSERDIVDPLASIAQKTYETYDLVARNDIKRSLLLLAERVGPSGGVIAERIDPNRLRATNIDLDTAITNAAREAGVDPADRAALIDLMHQMLGNDAVSTDYTQNTITPGREPIVFFFENGQVQAMRLGNGGHGHQLARQMFDALNTYGREHLNIAIQLAAIPAQATRLGVVTHPEFMAANTARDGVMAAMYDPQAIPLWTQIRGTIDVLRNADYVRQYYAYGGMMGGEATSALNRLRTERDVQVLVDQGYRFRYFDSVQSSMRFLMDTVSSASAGVVMAGGAMVGGAVGATVSPMSFAGFVGGTIAGGAAARVALGRLGIGRNALDRGVGGAIGAIAGGAVGGPVGAGVGFAAGSLIGGKALAAVGEISETATRARLWQLAYNRARANGVDEVSAAQEAAFWAHDYTDYSRRGSKMHILAALIPFLNANLQGNDVYIRRLLGKTDQSYVAGLMGPFAYPAYRLGLLDINQLTQQEQQALALSGWTWAMTIIGLGSISAIIAMMWDDDERVKNVDDRVKATHWLIPIGDTVVRIPKPFQTVWFSQIIERYVAQLKYNDPRWFEAYLEDMWNTWKPPMMPSVFEVVGTEAGIDLNTGRQIVPTYMQMSGVRSRPEQYTAYTSDFARWMGKELDTSPLYVDHIVHKFGASWGRTLTELNVPGFPWFNPNKPTKGPEEEFIARRFLWKVGRGSEAGQAIREIMGAEEPIKSIWSSIAQPYSKLAVAGQDYRRYLEKVVPDHAGSVEQLESLSPSERGYAVLEGHFRGRTDAKFRMLHPMNRAEKITGEIIKLQKEILSDQLASGKKGKDAKPIPLSPSEKAAARDILTQLQMMEAHNALVISRETGWENRILFDTGAVMKEFREAVPSLAKEYDARMQKAGVLPFAGIRRVWPELKARLESDDVMDMARKNQLGRLRDTIAGAYSRAQFAMPDVQQVPETVSP